MSYRLRYDDLRAVALDTLHHLFDCRFSMLLHNVLQDAFYAYSNTLVRYEECLGHRSTDECVAALRLTCERSSLRVAKVVRLHMDSVQDLLQLDSTIRVVYYTRDPRAIMCSKIRLHRDMNITQVAATLCTLMADDVTTFLKLKEVYPDNLMMLKYEELALQSRDTAGELYSFVGRKLPSIVEGWIANNTQSTIRVKDNDPMNTRRNATQAASKWRQTLEKHHKAIIESQCAGTIALLGYSDS